MSFNPRGSNKEYSFMSTTAPSVDRKLPFLPGYTFDDKFIKDRHHKGQLLAYKNNIPVVHDYDVPVEVDELQTETEKLAEMLKSTTQLYKTSVTNNDTTKKENWLSLEKKVLRFNAFFKEGVHESAVEQSRVRKCVIFYYLEDDTMHISEPKQDNSGIPQGTLVKRHRIPRDRASGSSNVYYTMDDLNIGREVTIYGKTFRIVDCDSFTREFYNGIGVEVPEPELYPGDQYTDLRDTIKKSMNPYKSLNPMDQDLKKYMEYSFKGMRTTPSKQEKVAVQKFLAFDRQVLRFFCYWDDSEKLYGDKRFFILEYYLSDDTMMITEVYPANSGYDPFPVFLKRQKVPRVKSSAVEPTTCYDETDLAIGKRVVVFSKNFLLYDCDEFTRDFFARKYGITSMTPIEVKDAPKPEIQYQEPPYNGFGDEEDSLGSWKYLVIKPPKKDVKKYIENDHKLFRYSAVLLTDCPEDKGRKFILSYYLSDDTISVFEPVQRNSGILGGKFLQRSKIKNDNGDFIKAHDTFIGSVLNINSYLFYLQETDEYTVNYMEQNASQFPKANIETILNKIRKEVINLPDYKLRDALAETEGPGKVGMMSLRSFFDSLGINIVEHEIITILRHFNAKEDGAISYSEFLSAITSAPTIEKKQQSIQKTQKKVIDEDVFKVALKVFKEKIGTRRLLVHDSFKIIADKSVDGLIGEVEFKRAVQDGLKLSLSDEHIESLIDHFFPETKRRLTLIEFMKIIEGTSTYLYAKQNK
ncbi:hypothetical protein NAEGRDRAFT_81047 [Naegleria gruberi]|uniref:DM10 domain-containing protein n=1 Tax=Naegleria gruberi TaxID=5762 RepID=D2VS90_NAEGR|nr:uncharacterized protein NAEGRDRAFT_81047 [Naegleria gruberi]EFC40301.1 hypothetical protein NAEGRDRAFT_81047 [Naegleria gruberi]|eukprot:XP_002673045.1 hypothetical protein NAEGRDRAFT_81047 [Naegleria gruberi strain NEG-M]